MPFTRYRTQNNAKGTLLASIASTGATTFSVQSGQGARFPSVYPYLLTIEERDANSPYSVLKREMVKVTNRSSDTFTCVRSAGTCLPSDSSSTPGTTAYTFTNPANTSVSLAVSSEVIDDIQLEILNKLASVGGLRTGFGAAKYLEVDPTSGNEVSRTLTTGGSSITSTWVAQWRDAATRAITEVPYSVVQNAISSASSRTIDGIAGEAFSANEWGTVEKYCNLVQCNVGTLGINNTADGYIGQAAGNTQRAFRIIGAGVSSNQLLMALNKNGAPLDNLTVRIETDSAGVPSGSLANANATSTIAGTSLSTGASTSVTVTLAGSITLTLGQVYWIVLARSGGVDGANYYYAGGLTRRVRAFTMSVHNGTSWGAATNTSVPYLSSTLFQSRVIVKTDATYRETSYAEGYATASAAVGASITLNQGGVASSFGVLTTQSTYYLSNTPGAISTTPGTYVRKIGYTSRGTSIIVLYLPEQNESMSDNVGTLTYTTIAQIANPNPLLYEVTEPTTVIVSGTLSQFWINGVANVSGTAYTVVPGDIITAFPSSGSVTLQILNRPPTAGRFLNT